MGKAALEGLDGVINVTRGFKNFREVNTVTYDPNIITPAEMKQALKKALTYQGTL